MKKDATKIPLFSNDPPNPIAEALYDLSRSVTDGAGKAQDASGGYVGSLTEAVIGITAGLVQIAQALEEIGEVMSERNDDESKARAEDRAQRNAAPIATPTKMRSQAKNVAASESDKSEVDPAIVANIRELLDAGISVRAVADLLDRAGMLAGEVTR